MLSYGGTVRRQQCELGSIVFGKPGRQLIGDGCCRLGSILNAWESAKRLGVSGLRIFACG